MEQRTVSSPAVKILSILREVRSLMRIAVPPFAISGVAAAEPGEGGSDLRLIEFVRALSQPIHVVRQQRGERETLQ